MKIEIKYDDREVRKALERLRKAGADMEPVMREIAGHLVDGDHEAFERQESPDGTPWAPLKPSTKKERRRKRYRGGPVLERSGDPELADVFRWAADAAELTGARSRA